jgi:Tfp pilus assembly protein PilO
MIPLKRAFDENRRLVIPVAAGLAVNLLLSVGVVYPMRARMHGAEQRAQAATEALAAAQQEDVSARGLVQGKTRTNTALQTFYQNVLPSNPSTARNITYLRLQQLAEKHQLRTRHREFEPPEINPKGAVRRVRSTMSIEGSYDDVRRFIYDVETGNDFVVIDGVTLSQSGDMGGTLQLLINLSTYYKHGE